MSETSEGNNIEDKIKLSWKVFQNNQEMIKFSDTKLRFLAIISGVITSYILSNYTSLTTIPWYSKLLLVLFFIAFLGFVVFSLFSSFPRFASNTGVKVSKLIYHKHISERSVAADYISDFKNATDDDLLKDVLYQVYEVAGIATTKFKFYNISWIFLGIQVFLFTILLIIQTLN